MLLQPMLFGHCSVVDDTESTTDDEPQPVNGSVDQSTATEDGVMANSGHGVSATEGSEEEIKSVVEVFVASMLERYQFLSL